MKRLTAPVLLVLGSVALGLALGELSLRFLEFSYPKPYLPDDYLGSRLRPGTEGWNRSEGEAYVRVNSDGLRDREHSKVKPQDTVRIAILGDSFAEALQVPQEATFWAHLDRELNACPAYGRNRVEVINFGVSGHGTAQQLLMLRHRAWEYSPDLVLLAFFPGNDVTNNSKVLEPEKMRPFFGIEDGHLKLDDSFLRDPLYRKWKRRAELTEPFQDLRVYQLLRKALDGPLRLGKSTPVAVALVG